MEMGSRSVGELIRADAALDAAYAHAVDWAMAPEAEKQEKARQLVSIILDATRRGGAVGAVYPETNAQELRAAEAPAPVPISSATERLIAQVVAESKSKPAAQPKGGGNAGANRQRPASAAPAKNQP